MIGDNWSVCAADDSRLGRILAESARAQLQRRRLRTTLDRANVRISAREAVDASRFRDFFLSDRYFASILRQAPDPIIALDAANLVTAWNRAAEQTFGLQADQVLGLEAAKLEGWPEALGDALTQARGASEPLLSDLRVSTPGGERQLKASVSAVRDDEGRYIGAAIFMHDVTAAAAALAAEQAARAQAEQVSRMKDEFLATVSHELRTPLSAVLSWAQLLQMRDGDGEYHQGVEAIQRNARLQAQLIDDLLDVARIMTGHPFLDIQPLSIVEVAERAVAVVSAAASAKDIHIARSYAEHIPAVQGDAKRLQQVLWNLLANAVKFTPRGGRVDLRIRRAGPCIEMTVSDSGQGIEAQFLPHLFERFRQSDSSIRRKHGGLGLGLAIVKQLVELHGGSVAGTSEGAGRGAVFSVQLPLGAALARREAETLSERGVAMAEPPPADPTSALAGVRVLVVEDEADSRAAIERILRHWGAITCAAGSVAEALSALETFDPQVLVSDIGMPGRDGYDLIRCVRRNGRTPERLPAVALTAYAREEDARLALAAGFQLHVAKPADAHRLVHAVRQLAQGLPA
jgi:PAS domain S-box-containing protein